MMMQRLPDRESAELPERIVNLDDFDSGLSGSIVIHSTRRGPAAGGCRLWSYSDKESMQKDAMRLAKGMSFKNAMAGLPLGGGKAVINVPRQGFNRAELFQAFGRAIQALNGKYVTAEDVGTNVADMSNIAQYTRFVAGLKAKSGRPGGDPSPYTARGVFDCMKVAVERHLDRPFSEVTVAVQGVGNVGFHLCAMLHEAGATAGILGHSERREAHEESSEDVRAYMDENRLPKHPLLAKGYLSIGCAPCTSPVAQGEDARAGRWRGHEKSECGIHFINGRAVRGPVSVAKPEPKSKKETA